MRERARLATPDAADHADGVARGERCVVVAAAAAAGSEARRGAGGRSTAVRRRGGGGVVCRDQRAQRGVSAECVQRGGVEERGEVEERARERGALLWVVGVVVVHILVECERHEHGVSPLGGHVLRRGARLPVAREALVEAEDEAEAR